jgi:hypothetical protein
LWVCRQQKRGFRTRLVALREQLRDQLWIVLDHARDPPDLHPLPVLIVHEEEKSARILGQIAGADILSVAVEIGKGERLLVDDGQEAGRSASMLDIKLAILVRRRQIERPYAGNEACKVGVDRGGEPALRLHARVAFARATSFLRGLDRRRKRDVG